MKVARVELDHDPEPAPELVETTWVEHVDARRLRRVAEILADILDNKTTPAESGRR